MSSSTNNTPTPGTGAPAASTSSAAPPAAEAGAQRVRPVTVLTGSTGAIGGAVATGLVKAGHLVLAIVRDAERAPKHERIIPFVADLSDRASIKSVAAEILDKYPTINGLVNNAAIVPKTRTEGKDGVELQWSVNVRAYFDLVNQFAPKMAAGSRVVLVGSRLAFGLNLNDPEYKERSYNNWDAYAATKEADRRLSVGFAARFPTLLVNSCHPGVTTSNVLNDLGMSQGSDSPAESAAVIVHLATRVDTSGGFFIGTGGRSKVYKPSKEEFGDTKGVDALFKYLETH